MWPKMTTVKQTQGRDGTLEEAEVQDIGEQKELPQLHPKEATSHTVELPK